MSLKDEIEKLVQAEKAKLDAADRNHDEFYARQIQRFRPLKTVLEQFVHSVDARFLKASISDGQAAFQVGRNWATKGCQKDITWEIQTNHSMRMMDVMELRDEEGFVIQETRYFYAPSHDTIEKRHTFKSETELVQYLARAISKEIAQSLRLDEIARRYQRPKES
jgi:hypothetical protein